MQHHLDIVLFHSTLDDEIQSPPVQHNALSTPSRLSEISILAVLPGPGPAALIHTLPTAIFLNHPTKTGPVAGESESTQYLSWSWLRRSSPARWSLT